MEAPIRVSIVICTRNRPSLLSGCLSSLASDPFAGSREVVVVDNGPSGETKKVVEELAPAVGEIVYVEETKPGHPVARNCGLRTARGELVFLIDDDVEVDPGWCEAMTHCFDDPEVVCAAGRVQPVFDGPRPRWLDGPSANVVTLERLKGERRFLAETEYPCGANFGFRRDLVASSDAPFPEAIGHLGNVAFGYDEFLFTDRVVRRHGKLLFEPQAVVRHKIHSRRQSRLGFLRLSYQNGFGLSRFNAAQGKPAPSWNRAALRAAASMATSAVAAGSWLLAPDSAEHANKAAVLIRQLGYWLGVTTGSRPNLQRLLASI